MDSVRCERDERLTKQDLAEEEASISERVGSLVRGSNEENRAERG